MIVAVCIALMAAVFAADQWMKDRMENTLLAGETKKLWKGRILLRIHHNRGVMMNIGQAKQKFVAVISVILTVVSVVFFLLSLGQKGNHLLHIGLALLLGGAFSNTYDRLKRKYVVDYFSLGVKWSPLRNVVFNMADFCIMMGALLTVIGAGADPTR